MKALWCESAGIVRYGEKPDPVPPPGWVRLKILAASVCGSDKNVYKNGRKYKVDRRVSGHEFVGVVDMLGEGVSPERMGRRVCVYPQLYCKECDACKAGAINICENRRFIGGRDFDGGFAEYAIAPEYVLLDVPDNVSDIEAAMAEPFAVGLHAVNLAGGRDLRGKTLVIYGTSPIGLFAMEGARFYGVGKIIMLGRVPDKLALVKAHGADAVINARGKTMEELREEVLRANGGKGADAVIDAICLDSTLECAMHFCRPHGVISVVGLTKDVCQLDFRYLIQNELTVVGSYTYTTEMQDCLEMLGSGKVSTTYIADPVAPLSSGIEVFKKLAEKPDECLKAVFLPGESE